MGAPIDSPSDLGSVQLAIGGFCVWCDTWVYEVRNAEDVPMHRWCMAQVTLNICLDCEDQGPF